MTVHTIRRILVAGCGAVLVLAATLATIGWGTGDTSQARGGLLLGLAMLLVLASLLLGARTRQRPER